MPLTLLRAFDKFIQISCLAFKEVLTNTMGVLCNIRIYANKCSIGHDELLLYGIGKVVPTFSICLWSYSLCSGPD